MIPSIDQILEVALESPAPEVVEQVKTASEPVDEEFDFEKVAGELESLAQVAESKDQGEQEKVAEAEDSESRQRMLKLAMVGTMYRTLESLESKGQLDSLIEKKAVLSKFLMRRAQRGVGSAVAGTTKESLKAIRKAQISVAKKGGGKAITPSSAKRVSAKTQKKMVSSGEAIGKLQPKGIAARSDVAVMKSQQQAAQARRAATATKQKAAKSVATAQAGQAAAESGKKSLKLLAGGAAAAGVAGGGLAYQAGRKQERKRQNVRRFAGRY